MKIVSVALAAVVLLGIGWSATAEAQGLPHGSYLRSCWNAGMRGDTLIAVCRTVDGRERRASLPSVSRCVGDIGNNNGHLQCNYAGGAQPYGQMPPQPGYGYGAPPQPGYGYGPPR